MVSQTKKSHPSSLLSAKKIVIGIMAIGLFSAGIFLVWASTVPLPDLSNFTARKIANSSKITDRTGEVVLYDINQGVRRTEIPLTEMGKNVPHAIIAIEDAHFYEHKGIRPTSIIRAMIANITSGSFSQGGSTITQQIIKNTLLNTDKTIIRKFKEWVLAIKLERQFSKDEILQIYLNDAPLGGTIYGVEEASKAYFNISAKDTTPAQAAYLAAMINAPTYYSPYGSHKNELEKRKNLVLEEMYKVHYLTEDEYKSAKTETVSFNAQTPNSIKAPHFVFYILDYLQKKYGQDVMESGGYTIKTTLDYTLQQKAEELVRQKVLTPKTGTLDQYKASNQSLVAIDPTNGQILTMVGSRDYFDKTIDGAYNIATANRQPGSSFKPFVYLTAFEKGYTPETTLFDVPTEFSTNCTASLTPLPGHTEDECYHPQNFDKKFKGPISMRSALAESRNVPAVKTLYLVGVQNAVDTAHSLGISTLQDPKELGLSLVLGGGEVKLLDMVGAYSVFANSGVRNQVTGILEVRDQKGTIVEQFQPNPIPVVDKNTVLTLNSVLSDATARIPTFGTSAITIPGVAVKTGTTNDDKDAWIIGYTPSLVVGVWSGNNDNKSMTSGGAAVSGPTWKEFMTDALKTYPTTPFEEPLSEVNNIDLKPILRGIWSGNKTVYIDKVTGMLATKNTPPDARIEKVITDVEDILYWVNKNDPRGPIPTNPNNDPQFRLWNPPVQSWWQANHGNYQIVNESNLPTTYETLHNENTSATVFISGLPPTMKQSSTSLITLTPVNPYPLTSATVSIDDIFITNLSTPFTFTIEPAAYGIGVGTHTLSITATNSVYSKTTTTNSFVVTQ